MLRMPWIGSEVLFLYDLRAADKLDSLRGGVSAQDRGCRIFEQAPRALAPVLGKPLEPRPSRCESAGWLDEF